MPDDSLTPPPTDGASQDAYRPRPPLWTPSRTKRWSAGDFAVGILIAAAASAILVVGLGDSVLNVPVGQVEVTVVRVEGGTSADEGPGVFQHLVALPDGSEARFKSERLHRPGAKLLVTQLRNRLTGRLKLGAPYREVAAGP